MVTWGLIILFSPLLSMFGIFYKKKLNRKEKADSSIYNFRVGGKGISLPHTQIFSTTSWSMLYTSQLEIRLEIQIEIEVTFENSHSNENYRKHILSQEGELATGTEPQEMET